MESFRLLVPGTTVQFRYRIRRPNYCVSSKFEFRRRQFLRRCNAAMASHAVTSDLDAVLISISHGWVFRPGLLRVLLCHQIHGRPSASWPNRNQSVSTLERVESTMLPSLYALPCYDFDLRASHARILPAALASVPFGFVLVRVRVQIKKQGQGARRQMQKYRTE